NLAFRHKQFLLDGERFTPIGDQVVLKEWKRSFVEFRQMQFRHPSYVLGLSLNQMGWAQYLTYQFAHGSMLHLFGNMFFLLIFGAFIEYTFGGLILLLCYFASGILGALFFVFWSDVTFSPLIGASGAISGLMAMIGVWYRKQSIA